MATGFLSVSLLGFVLLLAIVFTARFLIIILLDVSGRLGWRQADDLHRVMTSVSVRKTVTTSTMAFIATSVATILLLAHLSPSRNAVDGIPNDLFIGLGLVGAVGAFFFG